VRKQSEPRSVAICSLTPPQIPLETRPRSQGTGAKANVTAKGQVLRSGLENYTLLTPSIGVDKSNDLGVSEESSLATFSNGRSVGLQNIDPYSPSEVNLRRASRVLGREIA
jgi:hypothetical protein